MPDHDDPRDWKGMRPSRREKPSTTIYVWAVRTEWGERKTEHRIRGFFDAVNLVCSAAREFMRVYKADDEFGLVIRIDVMPMTLGEYEEGKNG